MKPESKNTQGKRYGGPYTPAGLAPYGIRAKVEGAEASPAEPARTSSRTDLEYAERTALALREQFAPELLQIIHFRGEWTVVLKPERVLEFMLFLRDTWGYRMCHDVTSVDLYPEEPRFMVVYHLLNLDQAVRFRVKCPVSGETPEIDSVVPLWLGADYAEREVFDLMGIRFRGHPDLRRILMPDDYQHHPLRKDFPLTGFTVGIDALKD
jgi:NADH-quinone oxidoreductase subunit C